MIPETNARVFYGRYKGRSLRINKSHLMATLLSELELHIDGDMPRHPGQFFEASAPTLTGYALEIGFGGGEHLAALAAQQDAVGFIGCEAFVNGVAALLEHIDNNNLKNIRIFPRPIQPLLKALQDHSLQHVYVLFPDPWPKARHRKRRLVNVDFLKEIARVLTSDGVLHLASDDLDYIEGMVEAIAQTPGLSLQQHYHSRPDGWPPTRYEQKAFNEGKTCHYLVVSTHNV